MYFRGVNNRGSMTDVRGNKHSSRRENTPPVGLEPTIFGLEVQRVIHYATRAAQKVVQP